MLRRVQMDGIELPRLYIAEDLQDVSLAQQNGLPYIRWRFGTEELIRQLLRPTLEKMFPGIKWNQVLGRKKQIRSDVIICSGSTVAKPGETKSGNYDYEKMLASQYEYDKKVDGIYHGENLPLDEEYSRTVLIADDKRDCPNDSTMYGYDSFIADRLRIEDYVGDLSSSVDIGVLQKLGMLPKFMGDIADCIKLNLSNTMRWTEGYTKKLGVPIGNFNSGGVLPNLIIIDISASIPDGIAATMLTLADTLRSQCNADLIITSARSGYYPIGCELPKPQTLRDYYGRSNEGIEFKGILQRHIAGRKFGHVISFGDYDNPGYFCNGIGKDMAGTEVHEVHHYHTTYPNKTGYAEWVTECCGNVVEHYDNDWCKVIKKSIL